MSNQWLAFIMAMGVVVEGVIAWLIARMVKRSSTRDIEFDERLTKLEEAKAETVKYQKKTGA